MADATLKIHGAYGYTEESPSARTYWDSRITRMFEGINEINRLLIPDLLIRQNQRGRVPLVQTITKVTKQLLDMTPRDEVSGDELAVAWTLLVNAKKLALIVMGMAYQKSGEKHGNEREVVARVSHIMIDVYLAESALMRTLKARQANGNSRVMTDLTLAFVNEAVGSTELQAREALVATTHRAMNCGRIWELSDACCARRR